MGHQRLCDEDYFWEIGASHSDNLSHWAHLFIIWGRLQKTFYHKELLHNIQGLQDIVSHCNVLIATRCDITPKNCYKNQILTGIPHILRISQVLTESQAASRFLTGTNDINEWHDVTVRDTWSLGGLFTPLLSWLSIAWQIWFDNNSTKIQE